MIRYCRIKEYSIKHCTSCGANICVLALTESKERMRELVRAAALLLLLVSGVSSQGKFVQQVIRSLTSVQQSAQQERQDYTIMETLTLTEE